MADTDTPKPDANATDAVDFMREVTEAESSNRNKAQEDLKFRFGDQWPQYAINARGQDRPQLTINETDAYIRQVCNSQRRQKPRIKVHPVDSIADPKVAEVITGITRHVEVNSDADNAYDTAFEFAATIGWGYWRVDTDYVREDSFDQDQYIRVIDNPFTVYFDNHSRLPDGSDSMRALVTDLMPRKQFEREFPGAQLSNFDERGTGDNDPDWVTVTDIRLAEYMFVDRTPAKLVKLNNGAILWADQLPPPEQMKALNINVIGDRDSFRRIVKWQKQTSAEVLEQRILPGRWIPIVPVYWTVALIDGRREKMGLVRPAKDPQRMVNFWQTMITEILALAPKAKWLIPEGADEGYQNEYANANLSPNPVLHYKTTDAEGRPIGAIPQRVQSEAPPTGAIEATFLASQNLQKVLGIYDPSVKVGAQHKSDLTLRAERSQSEDSNYHGYDNLTRSIKHTGRIILDRTPIVYDTQRVMRIIGEDGTPDLVTINEKKMVAPDGMTEAVQQVLNNVTVGQYDVVMDTGPGFETKRQESLETLAVLLNGPLGETVAKVGADLIVRLFDVSGAQELADRLAATNPMAQIDKNSDIPPKAQVLIKGLQARVEELMQVAQGLEQELKTKAGIEQMKQHGAIERTRMQEEGDTRRTLIKATADAHDTEQRSLSMQHSTEVKAQAQSHDSELDAFVKVLLARVDTGNLEREIAARNAEQNAKHNSDAQAPATV